MLAAAAGPAARVRACWPAAAAGVRARLLGAAAAHGRRLPPTPSPRRRRVAVLPIVTGLLELEVAMRAKGRPRPVALTKRASGQWVARVWPSNMVNIFFPRFVGEVRSRTRAGGASVATKLQAGRWGLAGRPEAAAVSRRPAV